MSEAISLYFIRVEPDGPIKIGLAKNVNQRLSTLQTAHHQRLFVFAEYLVPKHLALEIEELIHSRLRRHRLQGEWFEPHPKVIAAAKNPRRIANEEFERRTR